MFSVKSEVIMPSLNGTQYHTHTLHCNILTSNETLYMTNGTYWSYTTSLIINW